jgi:CheY-like chemotaxis protein
VGQEVEARLQLADGQAVAFRAEVSWARNDKRLVGLRFLDLSAESERLIRGAVAKLEAHPSRGSRSQILVADDEPNILEFLTKALSKHGYDVRKASRGEEALDLVRQLRPELVIMDILMPGIDGVDICKVMRADVEMADIPVVFLSALEPGRLHEVAEPTAPALLRSAVSRSNSALSRSRSARRRSEDFANSSSVNSCRVPNSFGRSNGTPSSL